jgi:aspartate aminotransferase
MLFPNELTHVLKNMLPVVSETFSCVSAPIQHASIKAYENSNEIKEYKRNSCLILKNLGNYVHSILVSSGVPTPQPMGGFYLFPNFESILKKRFKTSDELCGCALDEVGFAMLPASSFGFPKEILAARISYVDFDGAMVLEKAKKEKLNQEFIEKYFPNVTAGTQQLVQWIQKNKT